MYDHINELNHIIDCEEQKIINCGISGQMAIIECERQEKSEPFARKNLSH